MLVAFPTDGVEMTVLRVVSDLDRSRHFYRDVLGALEFREYGGTSAVLQIAGAWILLVTGGGPRPDKPTVTFAPPTSPGGGRDELTFKVPGCRPAYEALKSRGGVFSIRREGSPRESSWFV